MSEFVIGQTVEFQDEGSGCIADVSEDSIYIVSKFFTGWMLKAEYHKLTEGDGWYCDWCDKPMREIERGYVHTNGVYYCSEECAKERDANYF